MIDLCIYHADCLDGFAAAWAVHRAHPNAEFVAAQHGSLPPANIDGRDIVIVDFSYKRPVLIEMAARAKSILILDHHKTAAEDLSEGLPANVTVHFDMEHSGCVLAWLHFHPDTCVPELLLHVEDRDLWLFRFVHTRVCTAALSATPRTFSAWDEVVPTYLSSPANAESFRAIGEALCHSHDEQVASAIKSARSMTIGGIEVRVVNAPHFLASDVGHALAAIAPFGATYFDAADARVFSLRSSDAGEDVSAIARLYGGGGHRNAAGFRVPFSHLLAQGTASRLCWQAPEQVIVPGTVNLDPDGPNAYGAVTLEMKPGYYAASGLFELRRIGNADATPPCSGSDDTLKATYDSIIGSVSPDDPKLDVAYAIARYLNLDCPCAHETPSAVSSRGLVERLRTKLGEARNYLEGIGLADEIDSLNAEADAYLSINSIGIDSKSADGIEQRARELLDSALREIGLHEDAYHIGCGGDLDPFERASISAIAAALRSAERPNAPDCASATDEELHLMNNALCDFAMRWRLDGDYLRCRACNRPHLASYSNLDFQHAANCKNATAAEPKPWETLVGMLAPLRAATTAAEQPSGPEKFFCAVHTLDKLGWQWNAIEWKQPSAPEPVAEAINGALFWKGNPKDWRGAHFDLFRTPPAPRSDDAPRELVQQCFREDDPERFGYVIGWNACREAVLTAPRDSERDAGIMQLVRALLEDEGNSVTIFGDNPDFNGQPNCAIEHTSAYTGWVPRRFTGDTLQLCLRNALDRAREPIHEPSAPREAAQEPATRTKGWQDFDLGPEAWKRMTNYPGISPDADGRPPDREVTLSPSVARHWMDAGCKVLELVAKDCAPLRPVTDEDVGAAFRAWNGSVSPSRRVAMRAILESFRSRLAGERA